MSGTVTTTDEDRVRTMRRNVERNRVRESGTPLERVALTMAERGYGVDDVVAQARVSPELAKLLVLGG